MVLAKPQPKRETMRASFICRVFLQAGKNTLGGRIINLQGNPPVLRLAKRRNFLNPHYFHMVKIPRLAAHDSTRRIHLTLLEDPTLDAVDDPFRSPLRE